MTDPRDPNAFSPNDPQFRGSEEEDARTNGEPPDASAEGPPDAAELLLQAREESARLKESWMRTAADFDNFRKRSRKELDDARRAGREDLLRDLLPVFDNLERGMHSAKQATDVKAVVDGLSMILKQFGDTLNRSGIAKVSTVGAAFDPAMHEAIQQIETDDHAPGTVVAEVQPGYVAGERLVRAAMVVVAKPKAPATTTN